MQEYCCVLEFFIASNGSDRTNGLYEEVPIGILSVLLVSRIIEDPAYLTTQSQNAHQHLRIDYIGIGLLALCLGAIQIMLDRGQEDDWFVSRFILFLAVTFIVSLVCFIVWE